MKSTALLALLSAMAVLAQDASVSGITVNLQTGEPLAGVHVRLMAGGSDGITALYGAMSGADGRFSVDRVQPGAYRLSAERRGFMHKPEDISSAMVRLKPGAGITDLKIAMVRRAIITGRVLDRYGDPVPFASVQARPAGPAAAQALSSPGVFSSADDRGEYRLTVGPGKFHVQADPMRRGFNEIPETRTDGTPEPAYMQTYYPGATSAEQAVAVETTAGAEISGIDITLASAQGLLTVSGVVTGLPAERAFAVVMMMRGDRANAGSATTGVRQGGKFSFTRVEPGTVRLFARHEDGDMRLYSPILEVTLSGADVTNVELPLAPGGEVAGKLEVIGEAPAAAAAAKRKIALTAAAGAYGMAQAPNAAEVGKDGAFRIQGVPPGRFRLIVEPLPENAYVKAVSLDGAPVPDRVLDFTQGARNASLKVVVSPNGATVSGTVLEKPGEPVENLTGSVYLLSDPEDIRLENVGKVDANGKYRFKAVRPGKYRLFVVDSVRMGMQWGPDTMKKLAEAAEEVEIREGDRITRDIVIGAKEGGNAR